MKKILIILSLLLFTGSVFAQIKRPFKIVYSAGAGRVFNVSINNLSTQKPAETGWYQWGNDIEANTLTTSTGAASLVQLRRSTNPAFQFTETETYPWTLGTTITNLPAGFTPTSIMILNFKGSSSPIRFSLEGLDNSKTYTITSLNALDYDDATSETEVSFDLGVTYNSMGIPLQRKANYYTVGGLIPTGGIIQIWLRSVNTGGGGFTGINAFKIIEN